MTQNKADLLGKCLASHPHICYKDQYEVSAAKIINFINTSTEYLKHLKCMFFLHLHNSTANINEVKKHGCVPEKSS